MKKYASVILMAMVAVLLLAGCPGKVEPASSAPASAAPAARPDTQPPAAGGNGLAEPPASAAAPEAGGEEAEAAPTAEGEEGAAEGDETVESGEGEDEPAEGDEAMEGGEEAEPAEASEAGEEAAPAEDGEETGIEEEPAPVEDEAVPEDETGEGDEAIEASGDETAGDEAVEDDIAAEAGDESEAAEDEMIEEEEAPATPIDQFKALDPREIIDRKYEDLQEQHTTPWDEEDPEFIPNTGRVDPLTRVREAVPEELKPPRAGETDENDIISYTVARDATLIAYSIAYGMECYNVIQIGIEKQTTISVYGNTFLMSEGDSAGPIGVGVSSGIPLMAVLSCGSISENEVHVTVTVYGDGTNTSISKSMVFIPKAFM